MQSLQEARKGRTDWTMDLPKINYGADDDDESDDHSLIKVEDIELSSEEEEKQIPKGESDDEDSDELSELEKKYIKSIKK